MLRATSAIFQIFGGPNWINTDKFNIDAKAEEVTDMTRERLPLLLQSLLEDRVKLKMHTETRELPVYELMLGRNGPKLKGAAAPEPLVPGAPSPPPSVELLAFTESIGAVD